MLKFTRSHGRVELCESCARVCDNTCRADARRQEAELLLRYGWRIA